MDIEQDIDNYFFASLQPPEDISFDDWTERHIVLPRKTCPEPGPFRLSRTPYIRGVLQAVNALYIEHIVVVFGRQVGKSQGIIYPTICYAIAEEPGPIGLALPTKDLAEYTSTERLQPMFELCEPVRAKKTENKNDYTILKMSFKDSVLSILWAGSPSQMMSRPIRYLFRDEIDEFKEVGDTDPLKTIEETTTTFANRKIIDTSTPTVEQGNIWKQLKNCQHVFEYWVPCPECGKYQIMTWDNIIFNSEEKDREKIIREAHYECEFCKAAITETNKPAILEKGQWRARLIDNPCEEIIYQKPIQYEQTLLLQDALDNYTVRKIGFHLPKWYGAFYNTTFGYAAKEFLEANDAQKDYGDFTKMREWMKFWRAIPYKDRIEKREVKELMQNIIEIPSLYCPKDTVALTCGIDPGQGGYWFAVIAWAKDYSCHLVHYGFQAGELENEIGKLELRRLIWENSYEIISEETEKKHLQIWRAGIDTGGSKYNTSNVTMTEAAYDWIRDYGVPKVIGTKGSSHKMGKKIGMDIKIDRKYNGEKLSRSVIVWPIDSGAFKDIVHHRLGIPAGEAGRFTFNQNVQGDFVRHLLSEEKQRNKKNDFEWVQVSKQNHLLDCAVIAFALADPERGGIRIINPNPEKKQGLKVISKGVSIF